MRRSEELHGTDAQAGSAFVAALIDRLQGSGLLDDRRYAEGKAMTLRRRGGSSPQIRALLAARGVDRAEIEHALETADAGAERAEADLLAARAFARRRRLGPWRSKQRREHRLKDLAALGRAGFSYQTARAVIDGGEEED